jgi:DNA-binding GntR family transcriptional regulator
MASTDPLATGDSTASATPLYYQVREHMLNRILRGDWPPGLAIPAEFDLAAEYEVSRPTIREAIRALRNEGYLVARKGSGTFVRKTLRQEPVVLSEDGITASAESSAEWGSREIRREVRPVGEAEAALGLTLGSSVLMVERVSHRRGHPFCLVYSFYTRFDGTKFKRLARGHALDKVRVSGNVLTPYEAEALGEMAYTASLLVEIVRHDSKGGVTQFHRCYAPAPQIAVELPAGQGTAVSLLKLLEIGT